MLRIYAVSIQLCRDVRALEPKLRDRSLVDQMRRAAASVPLNLAESDGVTAGNRRQRRLTALGSARELGACFDVAEALSGVHVDADVRARVHHVVAVLVKLTR
ncbi:MAG: four helix bundle protein [Sandaracinus sp.]